MSANSLSHLLHASAGPEVHRLPTGSDTNYTIASSTGPPAAAPLQHQHHASAGQIASPYSSVPPPPPLPPNLIPQPQPSLAAQQPNPQSATTASPSLQTPAGRSHSLTQSLYQCADCQKRYSRPEHLARHIQTQSVPTQWMLLRSVHFSLPVYPVCHRHRHMSSAAERNNELLLTLDSVKYSRQTVLLPGLRQSIRSCRSTKTTCCES